MILAFVLGVLSFRGVGAVGHRGSKTSPVEEGTSESASNSESQLKEVTKTAKEVVWLKNTSRYWWLPNIIKGLARSPFLLPRWGIALCDFSRTMCTWPFIYIYLYIYISDTVVSIIPYYLVPSKRIIFRDFRPALSGRWKYIRQRTPRGLPIILLGSYLPGKLRNILFQHLFRHFEATQLSRPSVILHAARTM